LDTSLNQPSFDSARLAEIAENGFCIIPGVLDAARCADVRARLVAASRESQRRGVPGWIDTLDPNDRNVRVFNLLDLDPVFIDLIQHPLAIAAVHGVLGEHILISNFTANIALPGSGSMALHSDQALVIPEPWLEPWTLNVIWCLDDVFEANGATRYVPGSHHYTRHADVPADARAHTVPFEAPAGAIIVMDGRVWHTSGHNRTRATERALLFGYYTQDFIRPQVNWNVTLSAATRNQLDARLQEWLGLGPGANTRIAQPIVTSIRPPA
jgi:ectoine hydroxylase-related dioxygenase (phytanoyl-CoA dioxygenase family)